MQKIIYNYIPEECTLAEGYSSWEKIIENVQKVSARLLFVSRES